MLYNRPMTPKYDLSGRNALITGGARRLGKAFALALAQHGCNVAVHYGTSSKAAEETVAESLALGVKAVAVSADLADASQTKQLFTQSMEALGGIDILINNASLFEPLDWRQTELNNWQVHFDINLTAPFFLSQAMGSIWKVNAERS